MKLIRSRIFSFKSSAQLFIVGGPLLFAVLLFCLTALNSFGYDDEFHNIFLVQQSTNFSALIAAVNSMDVHPPGQFLINSVLWSVFGDWGLVRAVGAFLVALSFWLVWLRVGADLSNDEKLFSFFSVCLSPAALLWCTGVRWYSYFVPLINMMTLLLLTNPRGSFRYWSCFYLLGLSLFFIGYLALVLVPIFWLVSLWNRRDGLQRELPTILGMGTIFLFLYQYQLYVFFTVHLHNSSGQMSSVGSALLRLGLHVLSNQGALPVSFYGICLLAAHLGLFLSSILQMRKLILDPGFLAFGGSSLVLLLSTLASKSRNLVTISAVQGVALLRIYQGIRSKSLAGGILFLYLVGTVGSLYNVISHTDTIKGSWNTPYAAVLRDIAQRQRDAGCEELLISTHDPVFVFYAHRYGWRVNEIGLESWQTPFHRGIACHVAIRTFRGSYGPDLIGEYVRLINEVEQEPATHYFGKDNFSWFKRKFDSDVPDFYVTVSYLFGHSPD